MNNTREVLYVKGWNDDKIRAHKGTFPDMTVNLRPDANFKPMVTGLGFFSDGRLAVAHWGGLHNDIHLVQRKGAVYILSDVTGDTPAPKVSTFASGLEDPVGMMVKDDKVVVTCEFCSSVYQFTPHEAGVEE